MPAPTQIARLLTIPPSSVARAVRFVVAEQHLGGPLVGLAVLVVSAVATVLAGTPTVILWFFYSGTAADIVTLLVLALVARVVWFMGWGSN